jgi:Holliday junction resolvase RusA-like endonuclease
VKLEIPGRLPGLNEIIDAAKDHFGAYARMKDEYTTMVAWLAKKLPKYEKVALIITWYEPDRRRDPDNIMAGQKFILDGLVVAGTIPNDNQRHIQGIIHRFGVDKQNPRVEVEIIDMEKASGEFEGQELWD